MALSFDEMFPPEGTAAPKTNAPKPPKKALSFDEMFPPEGQKPVTAPAPTGIPMKSAQAQPWELGAVSRFQRSKSNIRGGEPFVESVNYPTAPRTKRNVSGVTDEAWDSMNPEQRLTVAKDEEQFANDRNGIGAPERTNIQRLADLLRTATAGLTGLGSVVADVASPDKAPILYKTGIPIVDNTQNVVGRMADATASGGRALLNYGNAAQDYMGIKHTPQADALNSAIDDYLNKFQESRTASTNAENAWRGKNGMKSLAEETADNPFEGFSANLGEIRDEQRSRRSAGFQYKDREQQAAMKGGFVSTLNYALNPISGDPLHFIEGVGVESLPYLLAGGLAGRGAKALGATTEGATNAAVLTGSGIDTLSGAKDASTAVMNMPIEELANSEVFQKIKSQFPEMEDEDIRQSLAQRAFDATAGAGLPASALIGSVGTRLGLNPLEAALAGKVKGFTGSRVASGLSSGLREAVGEFPEEASQQQAQNLGEIQGGARSQDRIFEDVASAGAAGVALGGALGGLTGLTSPKAIQEASAEAVSPVQPVPFTASPEAPIAPEAALGSIGKAIEQAATQTATQAQDRNEQMASAGTAIDNRLAELKSATKTMLSREEATTLNEEMKDLQGLLAEQDKMKKDGVLLSPESRLTDSEIEQATQRVTEIKQRLEAHRAGRSADGQLKTLESRLSKIDNDNQLLELANSFNTMSPVVKDSLTTEQPQNLGDIGKAEQPEAQLPDAMALLGAIDELKSSVAGTDSADPLDVFLAGLEMPAPQAESTGALSPETPKPAGQVPDRRKDAAKRQRVDEMTPDEMRSALLTSPVTAWKNRRAYDESPDKPWKAFADLDGLKEINDTYGHKAGDMLIATASDIMYDAGVDPYHLSGDEFAGKFDSEEELDAKMQKAQAEYAKNEFTFTLPDGKKIIKTGLGFSYGKGQTLESADVALKADKQRRKQLGLREGKRDAPDSEGVYADAPEGNQTDINQTPERKSRPVEAKAYRAGKTKLAVQMKDGTWMVRNKKQGQWQPWQARETFDASPAFGYQPHSPASGIVRVNGKNVVVGEKVQEAAFTKDVPSLLDDLPKARWNGGNGWKVGLDRDAFKKEGVDPRQLTQRVGFNYVFRKEDGMSLHDLREWMENNDYLPEDSYDNDALDLLMTALGGEKVYNSEARQAVLEEQENLRQEELEAEQTEKAATDDDPYADVPFSRKEVADEITSREGRFGTGIRKGLAGERTAASNHIESSLKRHVARADGTRHAEKGKDGSPILVGDIRIAEVPRNALPDSLASALRQFESTLQTGKIAVITDEGSKMGLWFDGVFDNNTMYLNANGEQPLLTTAAHEFLHGLRKSDPDLYERLRAYVEEYGFETKHSKDYGYDRELGYSKDKGVEELTANLTGEAMTNRKFLNDMAKREPSLFKDLADAFIKYLDDLLAVFGKQKQFVGNEYVQDVQAFRDLLADVIVEKAKRTDAKNNQTRSLPKGSDIFSEATQAETIKAAEQAKATKRNGATDKRSDMMAGDGELFAGERPEQGALFSRAQTETQNFKAWSNNAPLVTSEQAETYPFKTGENVVVEAFHGTKRPDRIGNRFRKNRATSGPMAFHTSSPVLGSNYATSKSDTSIAYENTNYENWFKVKLEGDRSATDIVRSWYRLPSDVKETIRETAPKITFGEEQYDADGKYIGQPIIVDENESEGLGGYAWEYERTRRVGYGGNPLKALVENWLNSGSIFNREEQFMEVLKLAGFPMKSVTFDSPNAEYPAVYKNFIHMQSPLVTNDIPQSVVDALNSAARKDRSRAAGAGADMWDKNTRTLREWVDAFNEKDRAYVWTSIPDKVTALFKSLGYDGIIDWAGKGGNSITPPVYIPFEENQVKSAISNKGSFDRGKNRIDFSRKKVESSKDWTFSPLARMVEGAPLKQVAADQWKKWIAANANKMGVKADELEYTGINEWLDLQQGKVAKEAIAEYLDAGGVQVVDVMKGDEGNLADLPEGWEVMDETGGGGDSNFYVYDEDGDVPLFSRRQPVGFKDGKWQGLEATKNDLVEDFQDRMVSWKKIQNQIEKSNSTPIEDAANVYRLENLMHGKVSDNIKKLERSFYAPISKEIDRLGLTTDDVQLYMIARHAPERNASIAEINPKMPDGGSGVNTAEAEAYMAAIPQEKRGKLDAIARRIDALVEDTRKRMLESGMIDQAQYNGLKKWKYYAPLRGKQGAETFGAFGAKGVDVRGKLVRNAMGRGSGNGAENVLGEIIGDSIKSVIAAERATVGRAVLRLVSENPSPLWQIDPVQSERYINAAGEVAERTMSNMNDPAVLVVKHKGKAYSVKINDDRLVQAIKAMDSSQLADGLKYFAMLNRYFSAVLTQYNPAFVPVNAIRDFTFGLSGLAAEHGAVIAANASAHYPQAARAAYRHSTGKAPIGKMGQYADEFAEAGGQTGYMNMDTVEELQQKIKSGSFGSFNPQGVAAGLRGMADFVSDVNSAVENALRLSAYAALRDSGMSADAAAEYAKNMTVNFNRKGRYGANLNAIILFFNAAMQGATRAGQLVRNPKLLVGLGALAGLQALLAMYAMGIDDDETGEPLWNTIPDYVKRRNLVIPTASGKVYYLPLQYGFNVFPYMAGRTVDALTQEDDRPQDSAANLVGDFSAALLESFFPVPLDEGAMGVIPHFIKPFIEIERNKDGLGRRIRDEPMSSEYPVPRSTLGRPDTPEAYKGIAKGLNRMAGGTDYVAPARPFDWAPEDIEHLLKTFTGGAGQFVMDSARLGEKVWSGLDVTPRDIPILKRFMSQTEPSATSASLFYDRREEIGRKDDQLRDILKRDGAEAAREFFDNSKEFTGAKMTIKGDELTLKVAKEDSVFGLYKAAQKAAKAHRELVREQYEAAPPSLIPNAKTAERSRLIRESELERAKVMSEFNRAWREASAE